MGLIRLIIFGLVIWLIWRMLKNFQINQSGTGKQHKKIDKKNMVMCQYCSVHIPETEAVSHGDLWFCDEQHKQKYLAGEK